MKIEKVVIRGLNGKADHEFTFHEDINVVTGGNGSGKTTLLKILWYAISGNISQIVSEIDFEYLRIETSLDSIIIKNDKKEVYVSLSFGAQPEIHEYRGSIKDQELRWQSEFFRNNGSSLFFPTFRRIEGGYSIPGDQLIFRGIDDVRRRLSTANHRFIYSIATQDIVELAEKRYESISSQLDQNHRRLSSFTLAKVSGNQLSLESSQGKAVAILEDLQKTADEIGHAQEQIARPLTVLSELVKKLFQHRGVNMDSVLLGDALNAIDSTVLSSGEKQMLSFLCYNAFFENTIIFIDEPELSLHVDWQRRLFSILLEQNTSNQFIVATHSPFIYAKYVDKELDLSLERDE